MNLKNAFYFIFSLLLMAGIALAQQAAPPTAPPPMPDEPGEAPEAFSLFVGGGSFLGVYAENVNKENMARLRNARRAGGHHPLIKDSPAEKAGLKRCYCPVWGRQCNECAKTQSARVRSCT